MSCCESEESSSCSGCDSHVPLQEQIRRINANPSLSMANKARAIQDLYNRAWMFKLAEAQHAAMHDEQRKPSYTDSSRTVLGCKHYARNCKLEAACCRKLYTCRFCHDESADHNINRYATENVLCMKCDTLQPVSESCTNCGESFARYFCGICKFFDNDPNKSIYHCDKCNICRVGKGLGIDNVHCDKCNACVSMESMNRHHCLERSLEVNCPICSVYLFTSVQPVVFMRCGHTMHTHCFEEYTKTNYTCPLCSKALSDMSSFYSRLDEVLANENLPDEYANRRSHILCNDCGQKSDARFHFMYHKCDNCRGYNTRVLQTFVCE